MFPFYTPRKHQNVYNFLMFSGGIDRKQLLEMDSTFYVIFVMRQYFPESD